MDASTPHFRSHKSGWLLAQRFFHLEGIETYLARARNEPKSAFKERRKHADARSYTRDVITRLSGALMSRYAESSRSQPQLDDSWESSVGAAGEDWSILLSSLAEKLLLYNEAWLTLWPDARVLSPLQVPSYNSGSLLVKGTRSSGSVLEGFESEEVWTLLTASGYRMHDEDENVIDSGDWEEGEQYEGPEGPVPPAVRIQMGWDADLGRAVASAHRAIYRKEADLDAAERNSAHSILAIDAGGDRENFDWMTGELEKGHVAIPQGPGNGHEFLSPSMETAGSIRETLDWKISQLRSVTYQELEGIQRQQTAAEAQLRDATGAGAALSILARTIESAENSILPLLAQAEDMSRGYEPAEVEWPDRYDQAEPLPDSE